jgi:GNAT superfamily N-acetyltransferase
MVFRQAQIKDIPQIQKVRHAVRENILSDPGLVTDADCREYLENRGRGWVCEEQNKIVGFAIADLTEHNIWALFVHPDFEHRGIGRKLHAIMLEWYFSRTKKKSVVGNGSSYPGGNFLQECRLDFSRYSWEK